MKSTLSGLLMNIPQTTAFARADQPTVMTKMPMPEGMFVGLLKNDKNSLRHNHEERQREEVRFPRIPRYKSLCSCGDILSLCFVDE